VLVDILNVVSGLAIISVNILDIRWERKVTFWTEFSASARLLSANGPNYLQPVVVIYSAWVKIQLQDIDRNANAAVYGETFLGGEITRSGPGALHQSLCASKTFNFTPCTIIILF